MSALNLAQSLIRIKSISPNDAGCFEVIEPELASLGFKIEKINGFANKTAKIFVTYIDDFLRFLHKTNLLYKLKEIEELKSKKKNSQKKTNNSSDHFLNNKNIVFTGVRNKGFEKLITSDKYNANIKSSISKTTNYLIGTLILQLN